jgi:hypothetical protein
MQQSKATFNHPFYGASIVYCYMHIDKYPHLYERLMLMMWLLCVCAIYIALWVEFIAVLFEELKSFFLHQTKTIQTLIMMMMGIHDTNRRKNFLLSISTKSNKN